ncbi:hypothetical protein LQZ13_08825 [Leuconostoc mesenteroides]|jgi:hypothetical protein|uniref:hypothetical protein n=1 Tax=Leuconostoc mesenteroides TaxID=1245 RepID=UPI0019952767|nr:hypothetical protein [Leuconostoc mesenteroides]MBD9366446.1 hypothetical protein [Leuconostoc mesenteroides]UUE17585.1 hypothetical protein LQZ13_08825 [Leuconostoc mesenteroides]
MIKLTKLEKNYIDRIANPTKTALEDLIVPMSDLNDKAKLAQYTIDTYDLGELNNVKTTVSKHILDFTCLDDNKLLHVTGYIEAD